MVVNLQQKGECWIKIRLKFFQPLRSFTKEYIKLPQLVLQNHISKIVPYKENKFNDVSFRPIRYHHLHSRITYTQLHSSSEQNKHNTTLESKRIRTALKSPFPFCRT